LTEPEEFQNIEINDSDFNDTEPTFTAKNKAKLTRDHNTFPLSHSPSELGEPTKTNPGTDRGSDKIARAANSTVKPRNNKIFGAD